MNEILDSLLARKSVRVYEDRPVEPEKVQAILQAAIQAPTAGNMSLFSVLNITDPALKAQLAESCDHQPFIAAAPLVLVFLADYQRWYDCFCLVGTGDATPLRAPGEGDLLLSCCDALIAAQNAVVAAQSLGLGSCYIGDILEHYEFHRQLLRLPRYVLPVAMLCLGYPTPQQQRRPKPARFGAEHLVFENRYRRLSPRQLQEMLAQRQQGPGFDMEKTVRAMLSRKWNSAFSAEMTRSVAKMIASWRGGRKSGDEGGGF